MVHTRNEETKKKKKGKNDSRSTREIQREEIGLK